MISPSKVQHQQHKQPSRDNSDTHAHVRLQKGPKPLEKKSFYLDIKNHGLSANLEAKIKDLGGTIELFLVKSVTLVVSDRADKFGQNNCDKKKWGYGSGGSGGPPSLKSVEVPTPIATPPTPFGGEYPLSNSTNIRGQTAQRTKSRADAMLERALTQPQQCSVDPLNNAQNWGIPIWATKKLQAWLEKIYESLKDSGVAKRSTEQSNTEKSLRVRHLKSSYIKFESFKRDTRPVFLELPLWPKLNFDGDPGTCPFDTRVREKKVNKEESVSLLNKEKGKEMTRRPRATATRARRTEQLVAGVCEICRQDYRDLSKHVQSDKHLAFVRNDDNFLSLDKLINAGASVEAFLRANEVGQDCNIFPDGDRSLHAVDLDDEKVSKTSKADLASFAVGEIKMVQCNGARRNLDLKLSPPHNLRTRAKHESGHLLRSKGSPWHELQDKSDKFYDKFEGFTIKKRAKGTIWIEEDEHPVKKCSRLDDLKSHHEASNEQQNFLLTDENLRKVESLEDRVLPKLERNDLAVANDIDNKTRITNIPLLEKETRTVDEKVNGDTNEAAALLAASEDNSNDCKNGFNGFERIKPPESFPESQLPGNSNVPQIGKKSPVRDNSTANNERKEIEIVCNGVDEEDKQSVQKEKDAKDDKPKGSGRIGKRSARGFRGRPRLSVEERLIEDNRAYYKVEVLGNKLRSSTGPWSASTTTTTTTTTNCTAKIVDTELDEDSTIPREAKREDEPSSEKPVVVRFKRVRKSELSLLSDEAESFMFGEPKRDESTSEVSDDDQSSVLPRETESDLDMDSIDKSRNLTISSSPMVSSSPIKQEIVAEDDSQDSVYMGRARKRRRTQTEALIKDNEDYYKFETPGSRLRFQGLHGALKDRPEVEDGAQQQPTKAQPEDAKGDSVAVEKLYPSKPSPEVEKMQFSFEAVPRSEPWYQTYQRQDEGAEFWHYFSEPDERKPFLLPYEIENFHETLAKMCQRSNDARKRIRGRGPNGLGRSPRKSPRCHASTLAIMSTIIRKREGQSGNLSVVVEEENSPKCSSRSQNNTPKPEPKQSNLAAQNAESSKSDVDVELREIAKSIDDMLCADATLDPDDSFEAGLIMQQSRDSQIPAASLPRGAPPDLLDLLDNCHELYNCLENSSCASSECGEGAAESPLKRRKRRKNRTGWPGIKMRKKLQAKQLVDAEAAEREVTSVGKKTDAEKRLLPSGDAVERLEETSSNVAARTAIEDEKIDNADREALGESCASRKATGKCLFDDADSKQLTGEDTSRNPEKTEPAPPVQCETISGSEDCSIKNAEGSENTMTNDENHENLCRPDSNAVSTRQLNSKTLTRKRQRVRDSSSDAIDSRLEIENNDNLYIKNMNSSIISRKNYGLSKRRSQTRDETRASESQDSEQSVDRHDVATKDIATAAPAGLLTRKPMRTRKRQRRGTLRSELDYEDQNCKKDAYPTSIKSNKTPDNMRGVRRRNNEATASETQDSDADRELGERVSPSLMPTTEMQNRRTSTEFQPVVRMMKIEDQVEMDHSILSVTVASNRRLRSSSSPRSTVQPPTKRYKRSKGPFGRWIKNS